MSQLYCCVKFSRLEKRRRIEKGSGCWKVQEVKGLQEMEMVHEKQEMKKVQEGTGRRRWCRRCRRCKRYKGRNRSKEGHKLEEAQ